jgi:protocatechuate 3,4-dioxygenase beta subunit
MARRLILSVFVGALGFVAGSAALGGTVSPQCLPTPSQTEGPYYPPPSQIADQVDKDNDLTLVKGKSARADGQVIYIRGQVRDAQCRAIEGALVEIWQASANGRYNHPRERTNPEPLDPNFQYWGNAVTDKDGRYLFKTIIPGQYPAGPQWIRPAHIHFKAHRQGFSPLTTQMYFSGDRYLEGDHIFKEIPQAEQAGVVVKLEEPGPELEREARACHFDLTLRRTE